MRAQKIIKLHFMTKSVTPRQYFRLEGELAEIGWEFWHGAWEDWCNHRLELCKLYGAENIMIITNWENRQRITGFIFQGDVPQGFKLDKKCTEGSFCPDLRTLKGKEIGDRLELQSPAFMEPVINNLNLSLYSVQETRILPYAWKVLAEEKQLFLGIPVNEAIALLEREDLTPILPVEMYQLDQKLSVSEGLEDG